MKVADEYPVLRCACRDSMPLIRAAFHPLREIPALRRKRIQIHCGRRHRTDGWGCNAGSPPCNCRKIAVTLRITSKRVSSGYNSYGNTLEFRTIFDTECFVTAILIVTCLAGLVGPLLVDARHWWPRKPKK